MRYLYLLIFLLFQLRLFAAVVTHDTLNCAEHQKQWEVLEIQIEGNKITRDQIILRELTFSPHDTLTPELLAWHLSQSYNNLINTALFNFVTLQPQYTANGRVNIEIEVEERWYLWPFPIFELADRNFNSWWEHRSFARTTYGVFLVYDNFRGRKETLKLRALAGFDESLNLFYDIPYINQEQKWGAGINFGYSRNHEVKVQTRDNRVSYFRDENRYPVKRLYAALQASYRKEIHTTHVFQLAYHESQYADTLLKLNPEYHQGLSNYFQYMTLYYWYKRDYRDNASYPLNGYYADLELEYNGFGLFGKRQPRFGFLRSTNRLYRHLKGRLYAAGGVNLKLSDGRKQPYPLMQGLGYGRYFVRGYEYYVIDGMHFGVLKSNLKLELLSTQIRTLSFIPLRKFQKIHYALYFNIYTDLGFVDGRERNAELGNDLPGSLLWGSGMGLDLVTYYDKVLRMEYTWNGQGDSGFFLHFIAPL